MCVYVCTSGSSTQVPNFPMGFHLSLHDHQSHVHIVVSKGTAKIKKNQLCLINGCYNKKLNGKPSQALPSVQSSICLWKIVSLRNRQRASQRVENTKEKRWTFGRKKGDARNLPSNNIWSWWFKIKFSWGVDPGMCGISASNRQDVEKWRRRKSAA